MSNYRVTWRLDFEPDLTYDWMTTAEAGILEALHSFGIAYAHTHIAPAIEVVAVTLCEENFTANSHSRAGD